MKIVDTFVNFFKDNGAYSDQKTFRSFVFAKTLDLKVEGVFRLSGATQPVSRITRQCYTPDLCTSCSFFCLISLISYLLVSLEPGANLHNVTGGFKLYLRELSNTVIPFELFEDSMALAGD